MVILKNYYILFRAAQCALGIIALIGHAPVIAWADDASDHQGKQTQQPDRAAEMPIAVAEEAIDPKQPLRSGFVVNVSVQNEPEPSGSYTVNQAGDILIHIADMATAVTVSGQTPEQAAETITVFLKTYLRRPHVAVSIVATPRAAVTIGGAVRTPGPVAISSLTTLADVLSRAEWTENANLNQVRITRWETVQGKEKRQVLTLHLDTYIRPTPGMTPDEAQNPLLQDRDVIFVPYKMLATEGTITVAGAVAKPQTGLPLRANPALTLREAISLSGGVTPEADRHRITVRRAGASAPMLIDLDRAELNDPTANITLRPDDAIYVERLGVAAFYSVNGGVVKPGKFPFDHPVTLTQAIMAAGGLAPFAHDKKGYILCCPDGIASHTRVLAFNWQQILAGKEEDIPLQPGDNVWIVQGGPGRANDILSVLTALGTLRLLF